MQESTPSSRRRRRERLEPLLASAELPRHAENCVTTSSNPTETNGHAAQSPRSSSTRPPEKRRRIYDPTCVSPPLSLSNRAPSSSAACPSSPEPPCLWPSCRSISTYERLNFIAEGSYGRVFRARDLSTGEIYALKKLKTTCDRDGFPLPALRELSALFAVHHENIVGLREVVVGATLSDVYLVLDYATHDLQSALARQRRPFAASEAKCLLQQLLRGVAHLHARGLLHRDLKPANVLLAAGGLLKICDFGLARRRADALTPGAATLWYRAPECLLGDSGYGEAVDVWAAGCIFAELVVRRPLFAGEGELDQISRIGRLLGRPTEERWPRLREMPNADRIVFPGGGWSELREKFAEPAGMSAAGAELLERMLEYDPERRITADEALRHEYFKEMPPPKDRALIQTFPDDRRG